MPGEHPQALGDEDIVSFIRLLVPSGSQTVYLNDDGTIDEARRAAVLSARAGQSPLGRTGTTEDVAYAMQYLAADASSFVTGQVIRPNGGVYMG